jgi:hypothetical protein
MTTVFERGQLRFPENLPRAFQAADAHSDLVTSKGESVQPSEVLDLHGPLFDSELSNPTKGRSAARTNGNV